MKYVMIALLALIGCGKSKELGNEAQECRTLLKHLVEISPQGQGKDSAAVVKELPIEDYQACDATEPEIRGCMLLAANVDGVKKCIPSDEILGCMQKAAAAKEQAHEKAKKKDADPAIDKPFDDVRAKCWGGGTNGDPHAADGIKLD